MKYFNSIPYANIDYLRTLASLERKKTIFFLKKRQNYLFFFEFLYANYSVGFRDMA